MTEMDLLVMLTNRWGGLGEERRSLPPRSGMTVTSGRDLVMNRLATEVSRWGGLGLPCEAQPKASRANPQEDRRSLPPRSGQT